ncbi:hypothetical protein [Mucilaginibacter antarcticus]|uniref:hypothetical protein n=1 Tax=Mucilaginibacter antarcticus TaxID=1855725 RepID=UPI003629A797
MKEVVVRSSIWLKEVVIKGGIPQGRAVDQGMNILKAISTLDQNALPKSIKRCARYVRLAMQAGELTHPITLLVHISIPAIYRIGDLIQ